METILTSLGGSLTGTGLVLIFMFGTPGYVLTAVGLVISIVAFGVASR